MHQKLSVNKISYYRFKTDGNIAFFPIQVNFVPNLHQMDQHQACAKSKHEVRGRKEATKESCKTRIVLF